MEKRELTIINGKLVLKNKNINEGAVLKYAAKKNDGAKNEKREKLLNAISKMVRSIMRGDLKIDDEKGDEFLEKIVDQLNKQQKIDPFFDDEAEKKGDSERDDIIELITMCPAAKLNDVKNAIKNCM